MKELLLLEDLTSLLQKIKQADRAYETSEPIMDDREYDSAVDLAFLNLIRLKQISTNKEANPIINEAQEYLNKMRNSNINNRKESLGQGQHLYKIGSLNKVYTLEEFKEYMSEDKKTAGLAGSYYFLEPKYDGINISLIYNQGELIKVLTRGDGETGEDLTPLIKGLDSIPVNVFWKEPTQINGELIISNANFEKINSNLKRKYKTPRTALMVFVNSGDLFRIRTYAEFFPHSKITNGKYEKRITDLKRNRFNDQLILTLNETQLSTNITEIQNAVKTPNQIISNSDYPLDGLVITHANTLKSVAIKHKFISYTTTKVRGNKWNISGKLAKLTCSLEVDPVVINNKQYTKVPFKNLSLIDNNEVMINQKIVVSFDGDNLRYESVVKDNTDVNLRRIIRPVLCPRCMEPLVNKNYDYYCKHEKCIGSLTACFNKLNKALDLNMSTTFMGTVIDDGVDDLYKYLKKLLESSSLFKSSVQETDLSRLMNAFNIEGFTPKDYVMLSWIMETINENYDVEAMRAKVHKLSLKDKLVLNFKRKMAMYYSYCEFNKLWIKDFFDLINSIKRG